MLNKKLVLVLTAALLTISTVAAVGPQLSQPAAKIEGKICTGQERQDNVYIDAFNVWSTLTSNGVYEWSGYAFVRVPRWFSAPIYITDATFETESNLTDGFNEIYVAIGYTDPENTWLTTTSEMWIIRNGTFNTAWKNTFKPFTVTSGNQKVGIYVRAVTSQVQQTWYFDFQLNLVQWCPS